MRPPSLTHYPARLTPEECKALAETIPQDFKGFSDAPDISGNWLSCSKVTWHKDKYFPPWTVLVLIKGKCHVETKSISADLKIGDVIVINVHRLHRARSPKTAYFLHFNVHEPPSEEVACGGLRNLLEYEFAMHKAARPKKAHA